MGDLGPPTVNLGAGENGTVQAHAADRSRNVSVLVTGFGPFKTFSKNASYQIATQLEPVLLPIIDPNNPQDSVDPKVINLYVWPDEVRVSYSHVFQLIPQVLSALPPIDYILHIGMAAGRKYYSLEALAHRDGYQIIDVDGSIPIKEEKHWRSAGYPEVLKPDLDTEKILSRWRSSLQGEADVRISKDAGRYLCDFIFYTSLALRQSQGKPKRVLFLHVPGATDPPTVQKGAMVAEALIRAMVAGQDTISLGSKAKT